MDTKSSLIRSRLANLTRYHPEDTKTAAELRLEHRAAMLAEHIRAVVDAAPPLTDEQRTRLAALLAPQGGVAA